MKHKVLTAEDAFKEEPKIAKFVKDLIAVITDAANENDVSPNEFINGLNNASCYIISQIIDRDKHDLAMEQIPKAFISCLDSHLKVERGESIEDKMKPLN